MSDETAQPDRTLGIIVWSEINTSDQAGSVEFYTTLLGWTTSSMEKPGGSNYTMFSSGGTPMADWVVKSDDVGAKPMWLTYISVEDVDASISKAKALGRTLLMDRVDLPMGRFVVFSAP
jgi:predicted enzyme related to lactoylglutathione lyase